MIIDLKQRLNQRIELENEFGIEVFIKREDQIHQHISGNKYRKLKYNLLEASQLGFSKLLTFGGAYSNHIAAVAAAGKEFGFSTIGVIRGEELQDKVALNSTLLFARSQGMLLKFVSRTSYRKKTESAFINSLVTEFGDFYLIPEGGTNDLAIRGCEEILGETDKEFDYICCAVGTGGTISGLINASETHQKVLGFPVLKGDFLSNIISKFVRKNNWDLITDYHFGGYAKVNIELIEFINWFKDQFGVPLDPVYTGKLMFGVNDLITKGYFKSKSKILVIHTGGLQGIYGMNQQLKQKKLPQIDV